MWRIVTLDGRNFVFCGMVIGAFDPQVGERAVFAVLQSRILDQIYGLTVGTGYLMSAESEVTAVR